MVVGCRCNEVSGDDAAGIARGMQGGESYCVVRYGLAAPDTLGILWYALVRCGML